MKKFFALAFFLLPALFAESSTKRYYESVGAEALTMVNWDWKTLLRGWKINFLPGRSDYSGLANNKKHCIDLPIRYNTPASQVAKVFVHELAHYVDWTFLAKSQRQRWYVLRHIPQDVDWFPPSKKSDYSFGAGDFAECVAWTLQQGSKIDFRSKLGPLPTEVQQQVIRQWLAEINTAGN